VTMPEVREPHPIALRTIDLPFSGR
jgi:hypothetical protein